MMAESKMAEVAKLFGKELGEEFYVKWEYHGTEFYYCRFQKDGFYTHYEEDVDDVYEDSDLLSLLLTGEAAIIDER